MLLSLVIYSWFMPACAAVFISCCAVAAELSRDVFIFFIVSVFDFINARLSKIV